LGEDNTNAQNVKENAASLLTFIHPAEWHHLSRNTLFSSQNLVWQNNYFIDSIISNLNHQVFLPFKKESKPFKDTYLLLSPTDECLEATH